MTIIMILIILLGAIWLDYKNQKVIYGLEYMNNQILKAYERAVGEKNELLNMNKKLTERLKRINSTIVFDYEAKRISDSELVKGAWVTKGSTEFIITTVDGKQKWHEVYPDTIKEVDE